MNRRWALAALPLLCGCRPGVADDSAARELRQAIKASLTAAYAPECGVLDIPDRAFLSVEVTGGGRAEQAVTLGRVRCDQAGSNRFMGTGGVMIEIWQAAPGGARRVLAEQMFGFTPRGSGLTSWQHGSACPEGAGPSVCRIEYEWVRGVGVLIANKRTFLEEGATMDAAAYDYEALSR